MPTGYTAAVQDGSITEFDDFAMQCARAFGALVMMRDQPVGAPIPERFEPSDFNQKKMEEAKAELRRLQALSMEEATAERDIAEAKRLAERANYTDRQNEQRDRYKAMLTKARAWEPPTPDHVDMKRFMIEQLSESIDFDCTPSPYNSEPLPDVAEWLAEKIKQAEDDVIYHTEKHAEEVARTESRNQWLADLRESLK